jgi:hypothetical protein
MYILLKPEATDDVVADFVDAGCISSRYDANRKINTLSELDLIAGAASLCFDEDCVCLEVGETKPLFEMLKHQDLIQVKFDKPVIGKWVTKMQSFLEISKHLKSIAKGSRLISRAAGDLRSAYREVTGTESSFDEYFYDGLEENQRFYSVSYNEELAEALSEIFGPDVLELA